MLGSLIKGPKWQWSAFGKHPAAADFIRMGHPTPLMEALADWAAKGYAQDRRSRDGAAPQALYSWRFWLRGGKKGMLVCGLGRDSCDRIGRAFPLLIMGEGMLKGWEKNWMVLAAGLNGTWKRLEYLSTHRFEDMAEMAEDLLRLGEPDIDPLDHGGQCDLVEAAATLREEIAACREQIRVQGRGVMRLQRVAATTDDEMIRRCHALLERCCDDIPRAVFIGGTPRQTLIAVVTRPLSMDDFIQLWSV